MACHGAVIAQRLVKNQKISLQYLDKNSGVKEEADLIRLVCADCPFEANDCDFRSSSPPEGSLPCGGYVLLYLLMSKNLVTVKDVEDACNEKS